jgi:BASS family bile acid:Na+ symporter
MSLTAIIILTLKFSIALSVFSLGLRATLSDATFLFGRPEKLLNSLVSMYIAMPLFAVIVALLFDLPPAVKIALVVLSISPIPPILPGKALRSGGRECYAIGLLAAGSLLSIILIPLALELFQVVFNIPLQMTVQSVANIVLASVLAPLAAGIALRAFWPGFAERIAGPVAMAGAILLLATSLPILIAQWRDMLALIGNGTVAALGAFALVGLAIGHILGGPRFEDRTVLALYSSARHPGVALAIAQANFPQQRVALAAIALALLVAAILSFPYVNWARHHKPGEPSHTGSGARA